MTFQDAINQLVITVDRPDVANNSNNYMDFLNRAVHEAARRHSWDCMKATASVTVLDGNTEVDLPGDFKEFQNGRFCVFDPDGNPVPVYARTELEQLVPSFRPPVYFTYTQDNQGFQVTLPVAASGDTTYTIYYFAYPGTVTDAGQTTPLLDLYQNMILSKTAALIFQSINDPVYQVHDAQFEKELVANSGEDIAVSLPAPRADKE